MESESRELANSADLAAIAEVAYRGHGGELLARPVTPVLFKDAPAFTLTYADSEVARQLDRSPRISLVFSDSRLAYMGWNPLAAAVAVEVIPDPEGEMFQREILYQELRKFRPSRELMYTPLARREHWWYVPRWIVRVAEVGGVRAVARRTAPEHGVLAWEADGGIEADCVRVENWDAQRVTMSPLAEGEPRYYPDGARAALFQHDFSVPDMEQHVSFLATGRMVNGRLSVAARGGTRTLGKPPGLLARWRAFKSLEKRCKAGLRESGV